MERLICGSPLHAGTPSPFLFILYNFLHPMHIRLQNLRAPVSIRLTSDRCLQYRNQDSRGCQAAALSVCTNRGFSPAGPNRMFMAAAPENTSKLLTEDTSRNFFLAGRPGFGGRSTLRGKRQVRVTQQQDAVFEAERPQNFLRRRRGSDSCSP